MSKILIVEDDQEIAMLERDYLEIEGYEVSVVDNGQTAVVEALRGGYALILLDLMLPGCNGYDICRMIPNGVGGQNPGAGPGGGRLHCQAL